jgi:hypothetical protein
MFNKLRLGLHVINDVTFFSSNESHKGRPKACFDLFFQGFERYSSISSYVHPTHCDLTIEKLVQFISLLKK